MEMIQLLGFLADDGGEAKISPPLRFAPDKKIKDSVSIVILIKDKKRGLVI